MSEKNETVGMTVQAVPLDWSTLPSTAAVAAQPPKFPPFESSERRDEHASSSSQGAADSGKP